MVFAESGLLIGFFQPGDSLLFIAGFLTSTAGYVLPLLAITAAVAFVAAAAGDQVGYLIGHRLGPALFNRPRSRLFNPDNISRTRGFFQRRGAKAVVLARFVPVVRIFTPVIAGVRDMHYRTFIACNLIGAAGWGIGVKTFGSFLGHSTIIKNNLDYAAIVVVALSLIPVALEYRQGAPCKRMTE